MWWGRSRLSGWPSQGRSRLDGGRHWRKGWRDHPADCRRSAASPTRDPLCRLALVPMDDSSLVPATDRPDRRRPRPRGARAPTPYAGARGRDGSTRPPRSRHEVSPSRWRRGLVRGIGAPASQRARPAGHRGHPAAYLRVGQLVRGMVSEVAEPPAGAFRRQFPFDQILAMAREPQEMQIDLVPLPAHDVLWGPS